jgi:hypothetical protein
MIDTQPGPQGLAALSMGNPAQLQQRVAKSPKDPQTGLPQDLVAALALSIVNNTKNAAAQDEAMKELQQAAGPGNKLPTVVQSLQKSVMEKFKQQPQAQPQPQEQQTAGLDQAPVQFGMAGGGIVAFAEGKKVPEAEYSDPMGMGGEEIMRDAEPDPRTLLERITNEPKWKAEQRLEKQVAAAEARKKEQDLVKAPTQEKPVAGLKKAVMQAPTAPTPPAAPPSGNIPVDPRLEKMMNVDPEARQARIEERMRGMAPDVSNYDRLVAELEKHKKTLEGPQDNYGKLMEYLGKIAEAGPQRTIGEAGTKGAAGLRALEQERAQQLLNLTKEQIGLEDKRNETKRAFEMDVFKTGQAAYDNAYKQAFDAMKEKGQNDRQAAQNATQIATNAASVAAQKRGQDLQHQAQMAQVAAMSERGQGSLEAKLGKDIQTAIEKDIPLKTLEIQMLNKSPDEQARIQNLIDQRKKAIAQDVMKTRAIASGAPTGGAPLPQGVTITKVGS